MHPYLFSWGPFLVHSYGVTMSLGFLAAGLVTFYGFKRKGLDTEPIIWLVALAALGGVIGAKADYILVNLNDMSTDPASLFSGAGLVWYGGVIGGLALTWIFLSVKKIPKGKAFDAVAPAIALGLAFGRVGCFLMGTCYGKPSTLPWAVAFPNGMLPTPPGVSVQPSQLYEMLASLVIFGVLIYLAPRLKRDWALISLYMVLAGTTRFLLEFLRFSRDGQIQAQSIAFTIATIGAFGLYWVMKRTPTRQNRIGMSEV